MMTINKKKAEEDYKKFIEQFKDDLEDYTKDKMKQLKVSKEKQQEVFKIIKGELKDMNNLNKEYIELPGLNYVGGFETIEEFEKAYSRRVSKDVLEEFKKTINEDILRKQKNRQEIKFPIRFGGNIIYNGFVFLYDVVKTEDSVEIIDIKLIGVE